MKYTHSICWIRRDIRLQDQRALSSAKQNSDFVTVVFVFDTNILNQLPNKADRRLTFIHQSLQELNTKLQAKNSQLVILHGDPAIEIPRVAKLLSADAVYAGMDFEPYAKLRDQRVHENLQASGCFFHLVKDQVIFSGLEVRKKDGTPYKVFSAYKKQWLKQLQPEDYFNTSIQRENFIHHQKLKTLAHDWTLKDFGFIKSPLWLDPGENEARLQLRKFSSVMDQYHQTRNLPALTNGTSKLSAHLRFGTISIRACVREALLKKKTEGGQTWLNELIWRDFYQMILDQFPHVVKESFKPKYADIRWPGLDEHFEKWCAGQTGYPLVDAAMRHFAKTGWMHNRLRMITAIFLAKDLLVDWKRGEQYFAENLLDFDLAANNGGWQWCASTGCDAQPYFRIFNPVTQSQKFDAKGAFIRLHCPELHGFPDKYLHAPWKASIAVQKAAGCMLGKDYPKPIVDHAKQRIRALRLYKKAV